MPRLPRLFVREWRCPRCGAPARQPCIAERGSARESNHLERVELAAADPRSREFDDLRSLSETFVLEFSCPACSAHPGEHCIGAREKLLELPHLDRAAMAKRDPRAESFKARSEIPAVLVRRVACPYCGAAAGAACRGARNLRETAHAARAVAAQHSLPR
jgi:hypothetical protein